MREVVEKKVSARMTGWRGVAPALPRTEHSLRQFHQLAGLRENALLEKTLGSLRRARQFAVLTGDLQTDNDARAYALRLSGAADRYGRDCI